MLTKQAIKKLRANTVFSDPYIIRPAQIKPAIMKNLITSEPRTILLNFSSPRREALFRIITAAAEFAAQIITAANTGEIIFYLSGRVSFCLRLAPF